MRPFPELIRKDGARGAADARMARLHSRLTVATDTLRASAVSSRLNPLKKRISTIWPLRTTLTIALCHDTG
jgi:hypothetical protein